MRRPDLVLRGLKLALGTLWSGVWVILGLWLMKNTLPALGVGPIAAGLLVLMVLVVDDLVPGASPRMTGFMKLTAALVFGEWALLASWWALAATPI